MSSLKHPIEIWFSTVSYWELDWHTALVEARRAGYETVELISVIGLGSQPQPGEVRAAEIAEAAQAAGVRIASVHAGGIDGNSDAGRDRMVDHIAGCIEMVAPLGISRVVFTGFDKPADYSAQDRAAALERIADGLKQLHPLLKQYDLLLGLENHAGNHMETIADFQEIFQHLGADYPNIGVTLDTGHFHASGIDLVEVIQTLKQRVVHVHIKDHRGHQSVPFGHGEVDNRAAVQALARVGYRGAIVTELEVADKENNVQYVHESLAYMRQLEKAYQEELI